ncbi:MAG: excinuclease ABC subunit UvrC [Bacteroidetes bacterium]|nr:excinuclease ABC subunit UvrC [Bacteroidota bacterium]
MLPDSPGVYKYFDSQGTLLYVGKAKSLKKRVSSYFNKQQHDNRKTQVMVGKIANIDFTVVDSEMDALLLENSLIKEFQPRYNINLKDDKTYPYIRITAERFPRVYPTRNKIPDGSEYYGPYGSVRVMDTVLDLIKKLYPTRNCNLNLSERNINSGKFRVCLEYHIGNCLGPCEARQIESDYNDQIDHIRYLLRGNLGEVKRHLKTLMGEAAAALRFEEAQKYKEKLELLERFQAKSTVVNLNIGNVEVCTLSSQGNQVFVNHLRASEGVIISSKNMEYRRKLEEPDSEILLLALAEADNGTSYKQREVISSFIPEEWNDPALTFSVPKAGDKKKLLELSMRNTLLFKKEKLAQYEKLDPGLRVERLMNQMKQDLRMKEQPMHIECFDNSNLQGEHAVSACVVFREGKPAKSDYRHFNVRSVNGPNDFDTMKEVITRRYSRLLEEGQSLPQLVVVDGGKGQLSAAVEALQKLGIYGKMAIVGIAKRLEEIYYPNDPVPLYIDKKSETLKVIQQMRDEAHRFGITHHRKRRDKSTLGTELTEIPGIGEETASTLLRSFRSVKRIREATLSDLSHAIGPAKGGIVYRYFHPDEG